VRRVAEVVADVAAIAGAVLAVVQAFRPQAAQRFREELARRRPALPPEPPMPAGEEILAEGLAAADRTPVPGGDP
jgi:D-alanyl-D-alanine dipeptidase